MQHTRSGAYRDAVMVNVVTDAESLLKPCVAQLSVTMHLASALDMQDVSIVLQLQVHVRQMDARDINGNLVVLVGFIDLVSWRRVMDHMIRSTVQVLEDRHPFIKILAEGGMMKELVRKAWEEGVMRTLILVVIHLVVVMAISRVAVPVPVNTHVAAAISVLAVTWFSDDGHGDEGIGRNQVMRFVLIYLS
jgi:hypothetical protein